MQIERDESGYWKKYKVRKPCPFCGGKAVIDVFEEFHDCGNSSYEGEIIVCTDCRIHKKAYREDFADKENPYYDIESNLEKRVEMRESLLKFWNKRLQQGQDWRM